MAAQRLGKRVLSKLQAPSRACGPGGSPRGLQKRHARVTVKYDRRELQRRLDVEKWIDGRLEELYRGRVRRGGVRGHRGGPGHPVSLGSLVACARCCTCTPRDRALIILFGTLDGVLLVDTETHTGVTRHVAKHLRRAGDLPWGAVRRQSWGIGAALSREKVGGGDVLKPNIDMVPEEIHPYKDS